ncbi:hypothetical protein GDO81_000488 [Engystomops pustulosus]|uniref:Uncharacterized protein n=1 Tax=Engystomops pustulosus TaxID=76066 RepID=A0AAV7D7Z9_ENGPU|nr:hypothetical protein GDO81_000488 [Engystomops pustulosus]
MPQPSAASKRYDTGGAAAMTAAGSYFQGRPYIYKPEQNCTRSYFRGMSYFRGNRVITWDSLIKEWSMF